MEINGTLKKKGMDKKKKCLYLSDIEKMYACMSEFVHKHTYIHTFA